MEVGDVLLRPVTRSTTADPRGQSFPLLGRRRSPTALTALASSAALAAQHRLDDLLVAGAPAEVAGQALLDLGARGLRRRGEQGPCRDSWPGMQNPHWAAPVSRNACWSGASAPSPAARPSTVVTRAPSASIASTRHESTLRPSSRTVQAPHSPTRQHSLVPVSPRSSRRTSSRVWCASTSTDRSRPLTSGGSDDPSSRGAPRQALDGRRTPRSPRTWSIARRYSGPARIDVGDGLASTNSSSRRSRLASSRADGSASRPLASTTRSGRGPRLP